MNDRQVDKSVYDGTFYREIGNFLREWYLDYGFTKGTVQETDFLVELLNLPKGARILDVGCGPGRHSLELARRGYAAFGVDISEGFVELARRTAQAEGLAAEFAVCDAREMRFLASFDAAICLCEGAFGLAGDEEGHRRVLDNVFRTLRPGGRFVLTAINAWSAVGRDPLPASFDPYTATMAHVEAIRGSEGESRTVTIYTTAFTHRELKLLLELSGFMVEAGYGCAAGRFGRKPLTADDIEIMMVAVKPVSAAD